MSDYIIKPASRKAVRPLIGLFAESGCGKTYSSLLLARGFVGEHGKIALVDSERGRGELYADVIKGGYECLQLSEPFAPANYIGAIDAVEQAGFSIGIIDSASHEWEGLGGVLDMAAEREQQSGRAGLHNWKTPKMEHAKFMLRMLQSSIPWIVCLRAKHKTRQLKENGKTAIVKDDFTTPTQADDFIFEMTAHGEILSDHSFRLTKCSHPDLRACFPDHQPITAEHGAKLAAWCGGVAPAPSAREIMAAIFKRSGLAASKDKIKNAEALKAWLIDHGVVMDMEDLSAATLERWQEIKAAVEALP